MFTTMNIANNINTYANITAYNNDTNKDYPNVSYIQATDEVKMYEYDPEYIVCKYNVTTTSEATTLLNSTTNIRKMYIDGVEQQSVVTSYQFSTTGEHIVKYTILGTTYLPVAIFQGCTALISAAIPSSITEIGQNALYNCSGLTSVSIPNSVTTIGRSALSNTALTSINIPNSVTTIDIWALGGNSNMENIKIGNGVTSILNNAFKNCTSLLGITLLAVTPPTLAHTNAFDSTNLCRIYVPAASVNAYKAAANWSSYASRIQAIPS